MKPIWLLKPALLVPLLMTLVTGAVWLAAEPICWHCLRSGSFTGWDEHFKVTEVWCYQCNQRFKPAVNLNRPTPLSRCHVLTVYY